jgi:hypothetical protein
MSTPRCSSCDPSRLHYNSGGEHAAYVQPPRPRRARSENTPLPFELLANDELDEDEAVSLAIEVAGREIASIHTHTRTASRTRQRSASSFGRGGEVASTRAASIIIPDSNASLPRFSSTPTFGRDLDIVPAAPVQLPKIPSTPTFGRYFDIVPATPVQFMDTVEQWLEGLEVGTSCGQEKIGDEASLTNVISERMSGKWSWVLDVGAPLLGSVLVILLMAWYCSYAPARAYVRQRQWA